MYDAYEPVIDDSKLHIKDQGKFFSTIFYIMFALFIMSGVAMIIVVSIDFNRTLKNQSKISDLTTILYNSAYLSGDCWACNTESQNLFFLSDYVENDLTNVDDTTPHFADSGVGINNFIANAASGGTATLKGIDLSTPQTDGTPTTSFILGNMTRTAVSSVVGLPLTHSAVMSIGTYNGDNVPLNTRCTEISNTVIYIRFNFNNNINSTQYQLCLCDNQIEYCLLYTDASFKLKTPAIPVQ